MRKQEFTFLSSDGKTPIHAIEWLPDTSPKGVLQIAHGVAEYIDRYEPFAAWLTERGFAVVGNDHIGHGLSLSPGAPRLYFGSKGSWNHVCADLYRLRELTGEKFPGVPYFLLGHSMGSFLTRSYLIRYPGTLNGVILMGTGQMLAPLVSAGLSAAAIESRRLGPAANSPLITNLAFGAYNRLFAPNRTEYDWLSVNPENVDRYIADPLCGGAPSIGLFQEMLGAIAQIRKVQNLKKMNRYIPTLFVSGAMDPVGDCGKGVRRAAESFRKAGVHSVTLKLYPDARHEILNDFCKDAVYQDLERWLNAHLSPR